MSVQRSKRSKVNAWQAIDQWADLMKDVPTPRVEGDLDISQIAERRQVEVAQAGKWAEKQVELGRLEKHKIKDPITGKVKAAYHPVHN